MAGALYLAADYAGALSALRPRGRAWSNDPDSVQQQVLTDLAPTAERVDAAAQQLLVDIFPQTTVALLDEWEDSLGLLSGDAGLSMQERQANIVAKLIEVGGQSQIDFVEAAAALGFTIEIQTYAPFRCGVNGCGDGVGGPAWAYAWSISVSANTSTLTNAQLLSAVQAIAPAETTVFLAS